MVHNMPYQAERVQKATQVLHRVLIIGHQVVKSDPLPPIAVDLQAPVQEVPIHRAHPLVHHPALLVLHQVPDRADLSLEEG